MACIAGDTNHVDSFRLTLENFSRFNQDAVYPYGAGGANASFALIARNYMRSFGVTREDVGRIAVAQRANALRNPHALMKTPLTMEQYLAARPISDPIHLFDCVMPCAGAEAFLVMRDETAASLGLTAARLLSTIERHNAFADDPMQVRGGWAMDVGELYAMAGVKPDDLDVVQTYDDYPVITMMQFEDLGFCNKGRGRVRAPARSHHRRRLSAQYFGRTALGWAGRRRRRLSRSRRGTSAGSGDCRPHPGHECEPRLGLGVRYDQL